MGASKKHIYLISLILIFMFLGIIGTSCAGGQCGGDLTGWAYVGYIGWVLGMVFACGGILSSQAGAIAEDEPSGPQEHYPMHTAKE